MPEWVKGLFLIAILGAWISYMLITGKMATLYGIRTRDNEPGSYYSYLFILILLLTTCLFILLTQLGIIPDFMR